MLNLTAKIENLDTRLLLLVIFIVALAFRLIYFQEATTFGYDQARDAFQAIDIIKGDHLKVVGPQSDLTGLHHGTLYWYLISPVYYFSQGNVYTVKFFLILVNLLTIFFIYHLTNLLFKNRNTSLLACLLFAISFEATQYARWLSNPSPALLTATISFWSLKKLLDSEKWALPVLLISWALSIQFEIFMVYQIIVFAVIWTTLKGLSLPKLPVKIYLLSIALFLLAFSLMLVKELSFHFMGTQALLKFFGQHSTVNDSFTHQLLAFFDRLVNVFNLNLWGVNLFIAGIMCLVTFYLSFSYIKARKFNREILFLLIWITSPILLHFFHTTQGGFIMLSTGVAVMILTAYLLNYLYTKSNLRWLTILALIIIFLGNTILILSYNKRGEVLFSTQDKLILGDELSAINWVYQQSQGQPFHLNTVTNPAFINTTWSYLFDWYGRRKYGYMPIWWEEPQVGVFGADIKYTVEQPTQLHFLIIEPQAGQATGIADAVRSLEDTRSKILKTEPFGNFIVEKRQVTDPKRVFNNQQVFYQILHK